MIHYWNVSGRVNPNQVGLGHELIHAERSMRGEAMITVMRGHIPIRILGEKL